MTNEEAYIRERMGDRSSFKVPEGYFDRLAQQVMERLPKDDSAGEARVVPLTAARASDTTAHRRWLRPLLYAAAIAVVAVFTAFIFFDRQQDEMTSARAVTAQAQTQPAAPDYFEEAADYVMLDNQDIYAYLLADM